MKFFEGLPDRFFVAIGMAGGSSSIILELFNRYAAAFVAILTIGILFPRFLVAIPRTVAIFRRGWRYHFVAARERLREDQDRAAEGDD